ncbi:uncharacterized protein NECHADRAFT_82116 [Fusarium vanettenii 77-13-4]|uniref:Stress-response A/B barrel domain-containing protein n=1 Tax=Fusarium vanettenii (strain ATCC MYA-4622 / CBS 123669 / FGSC 9596 / NRRL 45880 / 77-13-4) TaxID=660122 RepID=C7ZAJ2_FUSV7|nr:uncharacterized protein NECHADRAFT_82116 [Fusarium vanettenii 77-13-4]EEU39284.1 hypothetical protein NECHADRAFT_82116 [Fusarium vanettenii 77-13-4]
MAIYHVVLTLAVLFKLKPNVPQQSIDEMRAAGKAMLGVVPGLRSFEFGSPLASTAHRAQGFDLGLIAVLDTEADVLAYGPHPAHQAVNKIREAVAAETLAYDLEVPDVA